MADISKFVDKAYEGKSFAELADAPVDALQGRVCELMQRR